MVKSRNLLLSFLLLAAGAPPAAAADLVVTNYGVTATSLPWAVAKEKGFIQAHGVAIDGITGSTGGGTSIRNMMASGLPVAQVAVSAAVAGVQSGIDMIFVWSPVNNMGDMSWMVPAASPLTSLADLKGRKAAYSNPRSTTEMVLRMVLQSKSMDGQVTLVSTGGIGAGLTLLEKGGVDAAAIDEPALSSPGKLRVLFAVNDYLPSVTWEMGVTTRAFAEQHPEIVRGLVAAFRQAVDFIYDHPQETAAIYAKVFETDASVPAMVLPKLAASNYWSRGSFNRPGLDTMLKGMQLVGALDKPFDAGRVIDTRFLPADLR